MFVFEVEYINQESNIGKSWIVLDSLLHGAIVVEENMCWHMSTDLKCSLYHFL
jgi:hypothetical protein